MNEYPYGNHQTPSSRPPEPPYRSGSREVQPAQPVPYGETAPVGQPAGTASSSTADQSAQTAQHARVGEPAQTGSPTREEAAIPRETPGQTAEFSQPDQIHYSSEPDLSGFERPAMTASDGYSQGSTQTMPPLDDSRRAAYRDSTTHVGDGNPNPTSPYEATRSQAPQAAAYHAEPSKKTGGAGKTFLFGFLGALTACAIALGGFAAWNGANSTSASAATVTGTSDSTVIDAVEEGQTLAEAVAAKALPSVVAVYNYQQASSGYNVFGYGTEATGELSAAGMGSGVVISEDGYIITNYHVVEDAEKITVKVGEDERDAQYVGGDSSSDVAVLKIDNMEGVTAADIGNSDDLAIGEWVMTVGAPLGLEQSVATGVVSATNRSTVMSDDDVSSYYGGTSEYMYYPNMIQTDAVINPGNSGGALVDADGKLIGINTMISSYSGDYAGVGFAIPINYARGIAEDIIAGKEPTHAILGVSISSVNASNAKRYGLSTSTGAYIASIAEGTGAAESDLQVGDIITAIDGKEITSVTDVTLDVREHQVGDTVTVTVNRAGQSQDIEVTLSSDENMNTSQGDTQQQNQQNQQNQRQRNGGGSSGGGQYGYDYEQLEELLKMLGM